MVSNFEELQVNDKEPQVAQVGFSTVVSSVGNTYMSVCRVCVWCLIWKFCLGCKAE
jgi:hypothetical protein